MADSQTGASRFSGDLVSEQPIEAGGAPPETERALRNAVAALLSAAALIASGVNVPRLDVHQLARRARAAQSAAQELATLAGAASGAARRRRH